MAIFWILNGGPNFSSSRIQGRMIHNHFLSIGLPSKILMNPPNGIIYYDVPWWNPGTLISTNYIQPGDLVIFQTVGGLRAQKFAYKLKNHGVFVVNIECDLFPEKPIYQYSDLVICASKYLANLVSRMTIAPVQIIPDAVEYFVNRETLSTRTNAKSDQIRLCWVGNYEHWNTLEEIKQILSMPEFNDFSLVTISDHPDAVIKWSQETANRELQTCDAVVIPIAKTERALSKSNNRATQAMAFGAPVIAGVLTAYKDVIRTGVNGFLCDTRDEWINAFRQIRDPLLRESFSYEGWETVNAQYTLSTIGPKWIQTLDDRHLISQSPREIGYPPVVIRVQEIARYFRLYQQKHVPIKRPINSLARLFFHRPIFDIPEPQKRK
jgi:glycosyltransferase involved in cell wall biosynthesis